MSEFQNIKICSIDGERSGINGTNRDRYQLDFKLSPEPPSLWVKMFKAALGPGGMSADGMSGILSTSYMGAGSVTLYVKDADMRQDCDILAKLVRQTNTEYLDYLSRDAEAKGIIREFARSIGLPVE